MKMDLQKMILEVRGQKVILDRDLADLYEVDTKVLNQSVRRHNARFPEDFAFQLTPVEWNNLRSQIVTSSWGGRRHAPWAFSEQGVAMLSSVLQSPKAIQMNIAIVRAFIALRKSRYDSSPLQKELTETLRILLLRVDEHDIQLKAIYDTIENLLDDHILSRSWQERERIGFKTK